MAGLSVANILLEVTGESADAKRELADVARELALFSREEAEAAAYVDGSEAQRELDELKLQLAAIDGKEVSAEVNVRIAKALGDIAVIEKELKELDREDVEVDVDVRRGVAEKLGSLSTQILQIGKDTDEVAKGGLKAFATGIGDALAETDLFGVSLKVVFAAASVLIPVIVALAAGVVAMGASLVEAVAGAGALGVAFGAALVPGVLLAVGAVARFKEQSEIAGTAAHALKGALGDFAGTFKDATAGGADALFRGLADSLGTLEPVISSLKPAFTGLGRAGAEALRGLAEHFASPAWRDFFKFTTESLTRLTPLFARSFGAFADILRDIARAAMPFLIAGFRELADWLEGVADGTSNIKDLRGGVGGLVDHLKEWLRLGKGLGESFLGFLEAVAPQGKSFVGWLADGAEAFADWTKSKDGREAIRSFFEDVLPVAKAAIEHFIKFGVLVLKVVQFFAPLITAILEAATAIVDWVIGAIEWLTKLDRALTLDKVWSAIKTAASDAFEWVKTAASDAVEWVKEKLSGAGSGAFDPVITAAEDAFDWVKAAARDAFNEISDVLTAPIKFVLGFADNIAERARGIWDSVKAVISDGIKFVIQFAGDIANRARNIWDAVKGVIKDAIQFVLSLPGNMGERARGVWEAVKGKITDAIQFIFGLPSDMGERARKIWEGVKEKISDSIEFVLTFASGIVQKAKDIWDAINSALPDITLNINIPKPNLPDIPGLATGVRDLGSGGLFEVGEIGPELMYVPTGADVFNAGETRRILRALASGVAGGVTGGGSSPVPVAVAGGGTHIEKIEVVSPGTGSPDPDIFLAKLAATLRAGGGVRG